MGRHLNFTRFLYASLGRVQRLRCRLSLLFNVHHFTCPSGCWVLGDFCISLSSYLLFDSNVVLSLQMFSHEYCFNLLYYLGFVIQLLLCGGMCYFSLYSRFIVGSFRTGSLVGSECWKGEVLLRGGSLVVLLSLNSAYYYFQFMCLLCH